MLGKFFNRLETDAEPSQEEKDRGLYRKNAFSQFGEDVFLIHFFHDQPTGYYADFGAHHPFRFSNTRALYEQGWCGLNVDATPGTTDLFANSNGRDTIIECGVAEAAKTLPYFLFEDGALNSFDPSAVETYKEIYNVVPIEIRPIKCLPIMEIMERHFDFPHCDFINVDIEGLDYQVLKTFDFQSRFRPKVFSCELGPVGQDGGREITDLLNQNDFTLVGRFVLSGIFVDRPLAIEKGLA